MMRGPLGPETDPKGAIPIIGSLSTSCKLKWASQVTDPNQVDALRGPRGNTLVAKYNTPQHPAPKKPPRV
jgi:hypothetical protein